MKVWLWLVAAAEAAPAEDRFAVVITGLVAIAIPVLSILATKWASRFAARTERVEVKTERNEERLDRIDPDDDLDPQAMVRAFATELETIRGEMTAKVDSLTGELAECNQRHALADADSAHKGDEIKGLRARIEQWERRYADLEQTQHEVQAGIEAIKKQIAADSRPEPKE